MGRFHLHWVSKIILRVVHPGALWRKKTNIIFTTRELYGLFFNKLIIVINVYFYLQISICKFLFFQIICFVFFVQAEDGIRDRSPSRGLGDVYKRQIKQRDCTQIVSKVMVLFDLCDKWINIYILWFPCFDKRSPHLDKKITYSAKTILYLDMGKFQFNSWWYGWIYFAYIEN